jgi:subfamily B ATP-binding cassette protein MsbA
MKTYLRILTYVRPYWRRVILTSIFSLLFAVFNGISIYLSIPLLDTLFQESSKSSLVTDDQVEESSALVPDWVSQLKDDFTASFNEIIMSGEKVDVLIKICFIIIIAFLLKNFFGYLQDYIMVYIENRAMKDLRDDAYKHLHELPLSYFKKERVGNLISRFTNDVTRVQESIGATFNSLVKEPLTIVVFLGIALSISWELSVFALVILPLSMVFIVWLGLKIRRQSSVSQAKLADITSVLQETISGVKVVKAFGREEYENKKFFSETSKYLKLILRITRIMYAATPVTELISVAVGVLIIYFGGIQVLQEGTLSASQFMGFLIVIFQLMRPIKNLSTVNNRIQEASAAADRVFEILDTVPDIQNVQGATELSEFKDIISLNEVSFKYEESEEWVLNKISFNVNRGEIIALVGPSGGGKSTLVDLIPRFHDPVNGEILIDGMDIKKVMIESLRKKMGIVTQETFLFNATVKQNIAYGLDDYPHEKIIDAAKTANAHDFINEMPQKYDTIIGERGLKISGGQRQRLTIARALLKNPEIMIFDEATSALDSESEILVQEAIERLMFNRTTFVIAHRLSTIRNATKILVLDRGEIIQSGTHDELIIDREGLYKKLYEMQFRD